MGRWGEAPADECGHALGDALQARAFALRAETARLGATRINRYRMTAKRRLVPLAEVEAHIEQLRRLGVLIGAVDIRADGVTVYPPAHNPGNDFDRWQAQEDVKRDSAKRQ